MMKYTTYPVHEKLKTWIRYFWSYDASVVKKEELHIRSFADQYPRLIFQDISTFSPIRDAQGNTMPLCYLSGVDTRPTEAFWENQFSHFGVSFYPHALHAFFRINAAELTNEMPDILLLDTTEIPFLLLNAKDHRERVAILSKYFFEKIDNGKIDIALSDLIHSHNFQCYNGEKDQKKIARHYGFSERQLQRRFKTNVGVSMTKFNRLARFEKALKVLPSAVYGELTTLTYDLNYADQSHLISDFKEFSDLSPYQFIKKESLGAESSSFIYLVE
ncbi:helix-turn-helix domain-containing protein [Flavobacterium poyangense]|uniref:helix-turn-helix domain-containing protein n=1 Tax=Flavobacterium poyangense TaxID=2204302 RepID=UPI0014222471|nr:helix-turn-helix domain-containing protein [Flavobacterium sp. JXAS1]